MPSADAIRQLVIDALHLAPGEAAGEISSRTCARWDSLGQVAIAAAIYDRFGVAVQPRQVFGLTSLEAIAATIRGQATSAGDPRKGAADPIAADPEMLPLLDRGDAMQRLAELPAVPTATPIHLNVLATFTANALESAVALWGRGFGLAIDCHVAPYNQIVQGLLDPSGAFLARPGGVTVVLARTEDFGASAAVARAQLDHTLEAVARAAAAKPRGSRLLVGTLPPVVSAFSELDRAFAETLRYAWRSRVGDLDGVELFDFSEVVERLGIEAARSNEADALMRAGFSPQAHRELGIALVRQLRSARGAVAKVIALDCDNTLWGGVVGEVGVEGLELGPDGPGRAFQLFQRALKRMKERGVLLVVVSRNEPHDVREVFERHPEMVLRPDDIAAWRVNWNFKSQNLRELAAELNLGLDAFVFLDDDPAVRLEVKSRVPQVHVVPLPADPASYCETLDRLWLFDGAQTTAEDASRTQMTREEEQRRRERQSAASLDEFLASLDLEAEMRSADERDLPRVAQLTQRTNQFNVSLKRRTLEDIKAAATRATILVLSARDRFGDYGQVGVCILERGADPHTAEMDTFLMSCRALGRGVEDAFIHGIGVVAAEQGATELVARFVEGPRNAQVRDFLARSGFAEAASTGLWRRPLRELPPLPPHVRFVRPDAQELTAGRPRRL